MEAHWAKTAAPADGLVHDSRPRRGVPKPTSTKQEGHMAQDDDDTVYSVSNASGYRQSAPRAAL
jgi:hypothetical protein